MSALIAPRTLAALAAAGLLAGCANGPTRPLPPLVLPDVAAPAQWSAAWPAPGAGTPAARTSTPDAPGWQPFQDPLLAGLVDAALAASPGVSAALSRIAQAEAGRVAAHAALLPQWSADAALNRGRVDLVAPLASTASANLRAAWELDLWGAHRAANQAARARLDSAQAGGHSARITLSAEVALAYTQLRACEAQLDLTQADSASRTATARLTDLSAQAGFTAPAQAALARASAAQGRSQATQQRMLCDVDLQALVELTALDEAGLRARLAPQAGRLPEPTLRPLASVPAQALAQRPDLASAASEVLAAAADVHQADAERKPSISLAGSIGSARSDSLGFSRSGTLWSLGPVQLQLPLFDGGAAAARVDAAQARYTDAAASYRARLRTAVREVGVALLQMQANTDRQADAAVAAQGFEASFRATEARHRSGLASLFELEDARRTALQAKSALLDLQRDRVTTWISLYRALGGGAGPALGASPALAQAPESITPALSAALSPIAALVPAIALNTSARPTSQP